MKIAHDLGWKSFTVVELTALPKEEIKNRLDEVDSIHVNGGSTYFLMSQIIKLGLEDTLKDLFKDKIYIGSSAGSIVSNSYSPIDLAKVYKEEQELSHYPVDHYLGYVGLVVKTHMNAVDFPDRKIEWFEKLAPQISAPFYALDDDSALKVVDGKVDVVSEGDWKLFNG